MSTQTMRPQTLRRYTVKYSLRGQPRRWAEVPINAPNMQFIRDNWNAICGGKPFVIQKITAM